MRVRTARAKTALQREISGPHQLDALLQDLRSVGLVVTDVHRLPPPQGGGEEAPGVVPGSQAATYEVRVDGELGDTLVRFLGCSHYLVPEQAMVRLTVDPPGLKGFLQACTESRADIERVCLVRPGLSDD